MNLASHIFSFLREKGTTVIVPYFGRFLWQKTHAILDEQSSKILPPSEKIIFQWDETTQNQALAEYIVQKLGGDVSFVQNLIIEEVKHWKKELYEQKKLHLEGLGELVLIKDVEVIFAQQENNTSVDFFGLEEIVLEEIIPQKQQDYRLKNSILWVFLLIAPLVALAFLTIEHREILFGKVSFENTGRIKDNPKKMIPKDTIKRDTILKDSITSKSTLKQ